MNEAELTLQVLMRNHFRLFYELDFAVVGMVVQVSGLVLGKHFEVFLVIVVLLEELTMFLILCPNRMASFRDQIFHISQWATRVSYLQIQRGMQNDDATMGYVIETKGHDY